MLKLRSRGAALLPTGASLALAAGLLPAQAASSASTASTRWNIYRIIFRQGGTQTGLSGIDAVSAGNAWTVGARGSAKGTNPVGVIRHWTGTSWRGGVTLPSSIQKDWNTDSASGLPLIGATSSTNVWAFGDLPDDKGSIGYIRLTGRNWSAGVLPGSRVSSGHSVFVTGIQVISRSNVWVFGGQASAAAWPYAFSPYAAHYNGTRWKTYSVPGSGAITAASEISATNIWAVLGEPWLFVVPATAASPAVVQWNGSKWASTAVQPAGLPAGANLTSILASRGSKVWIGGGVPNSKGGMSEFTAELTGSTWTEGKLNAPAFKSDFSLIDMVPDGSGGIWGLAENTALGKPSLCHLTASSTTWNGAGTSFGGGQNLALFQLAKVPHSASVWGAGENSSTAEPVGVIALYGALPR